MKPTIIACIGAAMAIGTTTPNALSQERIWVPTDGWDAVRARVRTPELASAWNAYEAKARNIAATAKPFGSGLNAPYWVPFLGFRVRLRHGNGPWKSTKTTRETNRGYRNC